MKRIPFGAKQPNQLERTLLDKLGFDLGKIEQSGRIYI